MQNAKSQASLFFESFLAATDRAAFLRQLVTDETEETEWLEFKSCIDRDPKWKNGQLSEGAVKRKFSEAISGFANTSGGVLIWGIECSKNSHGLDAAKGFSRCTDPTKWRTRFIDWRTPAVDPPLSGIEIEAVDDPTTPGEGFVVCFIPLGPHRPHQSEMDHKRYVLRANDSFGDMAPSILRAMFHPRVSPAFTFRIRIDEKHPPDGPIFEMFCWVRNSGNATAIESFVAARVLEPKVSHSLNVLVDRRSMADGSIGMQLPRALHPEEEINLWRFDPPTWRPGREHRLASLRVCLRVFAHDMSPVNCIAQFSVRKFKAARLKKSS